MISLEERINQRLATQEKQIEVLSEKMGSLNSRAELLAKGMTENHKDLEAIAEKQDEILTTLTEARGSWKMIGIIGTVVAACAGAISWLIQTLKDIGG